MICVNTKCKEFQEAMERLNISEESLKPIVHTYMNDTNGAFPSDSYITDKLNGESYEMPESVEELWNQRYSSPMKFSDKKTAEDAANNALKFFRKEAVTVYRDNNDMYTVSVAAPKRVVRMKSFIKDTKDGKRIDWEGYETVLDRYYDAQEDSMFEKGRENLSTREEHHFEGEGHTIDHIKRVTTAMIGVLKGEYSENVPILKEVQKALKGKENEMLTAAMFHDVAKPFHHGDVHGWESAEILREVFKNEGYKMALTEWAVRHHMPNPFEHRGEFTPRIAEMMARDAVRLGLDREVAISAFLAINAADIVNGRDLSENDKWAVKAGYEDTTIKGVLNKELAEKRAILENAFAIAEQLDFGDPEVNFANGLKFDHREYPEGGKRIPEIKSHTEIMGNRKALEISRRFLNNFGIKLEESNTFDGNLFDAINRVLNISNADDITSETGYVVAFMMQYDKTIKDYTMKRLREKGYRGKQMKRAPSDMKNEIWREIGVQIGDELRGLCDGTKKPPKEPASFLGKLWDVIVRFFERLNNKDFKRQINEIAAGIYNNNKSLVISGYTKPGSRGKSFKLNVEKALREHPYEESIIRKLNSKGIALSGSASIALEGSVYRPSDNPMHDIDFTAKGYTEESLDKTVRELFPNVQFVQKIGNGGEFSTTFTYLILNRPFKIKETGISRVSLLVDPDNPSNIYGAFVASELFLRKGIKEGKFLDFFVGGKRGYEAKEYTLNGKKYLMEDARTSIDAKLMMGREKDIWDYNRFVPNNSEVADLMEKEKEATERMHSTNEEVSKTYFKDSTPITANVAIDKIINNSKNPEIVELAKAMKEKMTGQEGDISLRYDNTEKEEYIGIYENGSITINKGATRGRNAASAQENMESTMLHEMAHAMTVNAIDSNPELSKEVRDIMSEYEDFLKSNNLKKVYALKNEKEFIAEFMSKPKLRETLKGIKSKEKKSLWQRIIDVIKNALGIKPETTLFDRAEEVLDKILNGSNRDADVEGEYHSESNYETEVSYTPVGKTRQTYKVRKENGQYKIYNKEGNEVFKEDSKDRRKIFANLAVQEGRAVVVKHRDKYYVVNNKDQIISVTTGDLMKWGEENGDRKTILEYAKQKFEQRGQQQQETQAALTKNTQPQQTNQQVTENRPFTLVKDKNTGHTSIKIDTSKDGYFTKEDWNKVKKTADYINKECPDNSPIEFEVEGSKITIAKRAFPESYSAEYKNGSLNLGAVKVYEINSKQDPFINSRTEVDRGTKTLVSNVNLELGDRGALLITVRMTIEGGELVQKYLEATDNVEKVKQEFTEIFGRSTRGNMEDYMRGVWAKKAATVHGITVQISEKIRDIAEKNTETQNSQNSQSNIIQQSQVSQQTQQTIQQSDKVEDDGTIIHLDKDSKYAPLARSEFDIPFIHTWKQGKTTEFWSVYQALRYEEAILFGRKDLLKPILNTVGMNELSHISIHDGRSYTFTTEELKEKQRLLNSFEITFLKEMFLQNKELADLLLSTGNSRIIVSDESVIYEKLMEVRQELQSIGAQPSVEKDSYDLWKEKYSESKVYNSKELAEKAVEDAKKYFSSELVSMTKASDGQYRVSVDNPKSPSVNIEADSYKLLSDKTPKSFKHKWKDGKETSFSSIAQAMAYTLERAIHGKDSAEKMLKESPEQLEFMLLDLMNKLHYMPNADKFDIVKYETIFMIEQFLQNQDALDMLMMTGDKTLIHKLSYKDGDVITPATTLMNARTEIAKKLKEKPENFNNSSQGNPDNFNDNKTNKQTLSSNRTILSNEELREWNKAGLGEMPRILVASERTDPAFHVDEILDIIEGKKQVMKKQWVKDHWEEVPTFTGKDFAGLYLVTKHDGLPMKRLLETKIPKLIHFSITSLGGTRLEPGVMKYNDMLDRIKEYIEQGLDPNCVTMRIDPIVPGETKMSDVEEIIRRSAEMGIKRIKFSIMDNYRGMEEAMLGINYDLNKYYNKTGNTFHAKDEVIEEWCDFMIAMKDKYNVELHTCSEPISKRGIEKDGCLSVKAVNQMLGTSIPDKGEDNNNQRKLCTCYGGKVDALAYNSNCLSHCVYCYAKHQYEGNMLQYYNEDGSLVDNEYTRTVERAANDKKVNTAFEVSNSSQRNSLLLKNTKWSDITVSLSTDFQTMEDRVVKNLSGTKYIGIPFSADTKSIADNIIEIARKNKAPMNNVKLHITGNTLKDMLGKNISQSETDAVIADVIRRLQEEGMKIEEIRTSGESGIEEAAIKGAAALGVKNSVNCPSAYIFTGTKGDRVIGETDFKERFTDTPLNTVEALIRDLNERVQFSNDGLIVTVNQRAATNLWSSEMRSILDPDELYTADDAVGDALLPNISNSVSTYVKSKLKGEDAKETANISSDSILKEMEWVADKVKTTLDEWKASNSEIESYKVIDQQVSIPIEMEGNMTVFTSSLMAVSQDGRHIKIIQVEPTLSVYSENGDVIKGYGGDMYAGVFSEIVKSAFLKLPEVDSVSVESLAVNFEGTHNEDVNFSIVKDPNSEQLLYVSDSMRAPIQESPIDMKLDSFEISNLTSSLEYYIERNGNSLMDMYTHRVSPMIMSAKILESQKESLIDSIIKQMDAQATEEEKEGLSKEDREYLDRQVESLNQMKTLFNSDLITTTEVSHEAKQIAWWISDHITEIMANPELLKEVYGMEVPEDFNNMDRREIVDTIGIGNILLKSKEMFKSSKFSKVKDIKKAKVLMNNWNALAKMANETLAVIEDFMIPADLINEVSRVVIADETKTVEGDGTTVTDQDEVSEVEGNRQEHWQQEFRTRDVMSKMPKELKRELSRCYQLQIKSFDEKGNPQYDYVLTSRGVKERVDLHEATGSLLRWCQGALSLSAMVSVLQGKVKDNPWVSQVIERLTDKSGDWSSFQSQFFNTVCVPFQTYGAVTASRESGKEVYQNIILNETPALNEAVKSVKAMYDLKEHPMFTLDGINESTLTKFKELYNSISRSSLSSMSLKELSEKLRDISWCLGYFATEDMVQAILNPENYESMYEALYYINDALNKGKILGKNYEPFGFRAQFGIEGNLRTFLKPLTDRLEDTAVTSFFDNGKMYQSYTEMSYVTKLLTKFKNLGGAEFDKFLQNEYGQYSWFRNQKATSIERGWNNSMLRRLAVDTEARKAINHKVQLSFNKQGYMRGMSPDLYLLSVISEYFSYKENEKDPDRTLAYFRIPLLSNKPSSEFIRFYAYRNKMTYKTSVVKDLHSIFDQEMGRIQTVKMRNYKSKDPEFIKNFDKNGKKFCFLKFMNKYLDGTVSTVQIETANGIEEVNVTNLIKLKTGDAVGETKRELNSHEEAMLYAAVEKIIYDEMTAKANSLIAKWTEAGILKAASKIENIDDDINAAIENFIWNDFLFSANILELTITDVAFYKDDEDLQKRLAQLHAPSIKPNMEAIDYGEWDEAIQSYKKNTAKSVSDGKVRTFYLTDYDDFISNVIDNVSIVFQKKIDEAPESEKAAWKALRESLVSDELDANGEKRGAFYHINVADAQGYSSPTSYRKKAFWFGKWSKEKEAIYRRLKDGTFTFSDVYNTFPPLKPFVYTQIEKPVGAENASMNKLKVPVQNKNSEYLLVMADAIMQGIDTGRPNLLRAIYEVMEESADKFPGQGIDTVQFESTVKSGLCGRIDIKQFINAENGEARAKELMLNSIYDQNGNYNKIFVDTFAGEDYGIQQEVPEHFRDHEQTIGSQNRYIVISDLETFDATGNPIIYEVDGRTLTTQQLREEYEATMSENIQMSMEALRGELRLGTEHSRIERNIALSKLLQREILSSPRYGVDLLYSVTLNEQGEFQIPKGDPTQVKRIEQLLNSIIKNRVNKQTIAGGPVVQVTNFGLSRELNIRFKDKNGGILPLRKDFKGTDEEYKARQGGIAHFEVFAPVPSSFISMNLQNSDGVVDAKTLESISEELTKAISYRIPTEDKYSMAPLKIVGFLPSVAGEGIMFPSDITLQNGSDFDIDKAYMMLKSYFLRKKDFKITVSGMFTELSKKMREELEPSDLEKSSLITEVDEAFRKEKERGVMPSERFREEEYAKRRKELVKRKYSSLTDEIKEFVRNPREYVGTDKMRKLLWKAYLRAAFEFVPPTSKREVNNNKIFDMQYAVLTHESNAYSLLNPGSFDEQKKMGYMAEAMRLNPELTSAELADLSIDELKGKCAKDKNLLFIDTQVQFYKQNEAGSKLLGAAAVNKVAHAVVEGDSMLMNVGSILAGKEVSEFDICGIKFSGKMTIDPRKDADGNMVGKVLGSIVAASADTAKDPVLDLSNINSTTCPVLFAMLRMGVPYRYAALFLSQKVVSDIMSEFNRENLSGRKTLYGIIDDRIKKYERETGLSPENNKVAEGISEDELWKGIRENNEDADYKVLKMWKGLSGIAETLRKLTFLTRFNSIKNSVGPQIANNLMMLMKLRDFPDTIYKSNGETPVTVKTLFDDHPILKSFSQTLSLAAELMNDMPAYSMTFENVLEYLEGVDMLGKILNDEKTFSKLIDAFYSAQLLANGVIKGSINDYIIQLPKKFVDAKIKELYPDNKFIQAITLETNKKTGRVFLKIKITGLTQQQISELRNGWADFHRVNPEWSEKLFYYNFFRGGIGFNPKTFMSLVPIPVKESIKGYLDTFRTVVPIPVDRFINQFVRNNWDNYKLVPYVKSITYTNVTNPSATKTAIGDTILISKKETLETLRDTVYFSTTIGGEDMLFELMRASKKDLRYKRIAPLGNNKEYLEMDMDHDIVHAVELTDRIITDQEEEVLNSYFEDGSLDTSSLGEEYYNPLAHRALNEYYAAQGHSASEVADLVDADSRTIREYMLLPGQEEFLGVIEKMKSVFDKHKLQYNEDFIKKILDKFC